MSWVQAKLTELQKIRNAYSWAVSLNYPKRQIRALKKEYVRLLREDRELHPENHFSIDERIVRLEKHFKPPTSKQPSGTQLVRIQHPFKGWSFTLGSPDGYFTAPTINETITKAEKAMRKK